MCTGNSRVCRFAVTDVIFYVGIAGVCMSPVQWCQQSKCHRVPPCRYCLCLTRATMLQDTQVDFHSGPISCIRNGESTHKQLSQSGGY